MSKRHRETSFHERPTLPLSRPPTARGPPYSLRGAGATSAQNELPHYGLHGTTPDGPYDGQARLSLEQEPGIPRRFVAMDEIYVQARQWSSTLVQSVPRVEQTCSGSSPRLGERHAEDPVVSYQRDFMADLRREQQDGAATEPSAVGELPSSPQLSPGSDGAQSFLPESCPDTGSEYASTYAASSSDSSESCPNCGADHQLKHCPYPNTEDGRLQACFECNKTNHPWFRCRRYRKGNEKQEFYFVYVVRQGLCPVVHNKQLHELWRNYFPQLADDIQALTLQRPGPLTPRFVLRMLQDGANDPEVGRQVRYGRRLLPWDLPQEVLDVYQRRVKSAVLDPDTKVMSHKVVYTHMKTSNKQKVKYVGPQFYSGAVNDVSVVDRHNLEIRPELVREPRSRSMESFWPLDCAIAPGTFCMWDDCDIYRTSAKHCMSCGVEDVLGVQTLFTLPRPAATLERYGLLAQLCEYWHTRIHKQWVREDIYYEHRGHMGVLRCVHHPEIYQTVKVLQPIRANTLLRVAEQLELNPNNRDVTSFDVLGLPECPECFAIATLGEGDYVQRTAPHRQNGSSDGESRSVASAIDW